MIISTDAEKALKIFSTHLKNGIDRNYLNTVKAIYDKPTANIILNIPPKIRNKTRIPTFATIIQHSSGSPSYSNQRRKRNKRNPDQKRRSKASHCLQMA